MVVDFSFAKIHDMLSPYILSFDSYIFQITKLINHSPFHFYPLQLVSFVAVLLVCVYQRCQGVLKVWFLFHTILQNYITSLTIILIKFINMIYGYIRVSTEKQTTEVQKYEISRYCDRNEMKIDIWIDETISGAKDLKKRKINSMLRKLNKGDTVICTEISRLGRSMQVIWRIMDICLTKGVTIISLKENYVLKDNPMSKFILSVYSYAAETERILISERTKEGMAARKREGVVLGRPKGSVSKQLKLDAVRQELERDLKAGIPKTKIAKKYKVNQSTVYDYIKRRGIKI